ncbi:MAG: VCBS repeat-containing protein, partial [Cytophagales bacterium]|nr:VCBS repeat-containing protein [Cytophagales bacterium]
QNPENSVKFTEKAAAYGLDDDSYTTQAAFFDYDRDGDLDCFLLNHSIQQYAGFSAAIADFRQQADKRYGCKLLKNNGGVGFQDASSEAGLLNNVLSFGLGMNITDVNNDGWLDVYVSNDYNENDYLYINQKNGTFKESIREMMGHTSMFSMGTDAADINNDGRTDIVTLDMLPKQNNRIKMTSGDDNYDKYQMLVGAGFHHQTMRNMLQINQGNGFAEIGQLSGISNTDWSWSALFADFDNDGLKDLFVSNGYARDYTNMDFLKYSTDKQVETQQGKTMPSQMEIIEQMPPINEPNYIFKNTDGLLFTDKIQEWGFEKKSQSNGAAYADLDNDGDLDLVTNNINEKAFVYQNNSLHTPDKNYLQITLKASTEARKIGAKVAVWQAKQAQYQEFQPVRGFQSAMYVPLHFGLGNRTKIDSISVVWTDGTQTMLKTAKVNSKIELDYAKNNGTVSVGNTASPLFHEQDMSLFTHFQSPVNDFKIQSLLPESRSYTGPCMAKGDANGDGKEDIYVGGGKGQSGALFLQQSNGFVRSIQSVFEKDSAFTDAGAVFFDADADKDLDLAVVSAGYSLHVSDALLQVRLYTNQNGKFNRSSGFPQILLNAAAIAAADVDADGDQDVFIGANCVPGRFPEAQKSVLLQNDGKGRFSVNTSFAHTSLVTDAVFTDINGDKKPDLLLVGEWMQPTVYLNQNGQLKLHENTVQTSLAHRITAADLDNDGDEDFVLGNEGLNSQYNITSDRTLRLYAGDFNGSGTVVPVVTVLENGKEHPYASRDEMLDQVPALKKKFQNYADYSTAVLNDVLEVYQLAKAPKLTANELKTGILWNDGGKLAFEPLPVQAQFSPVHAITATDVNNDGKTDLILGGNVTQTRVRLGKCDANWGQLFINDGNRKFRYVPQSESGFYVKGDVRSVVSVNDWLLWGVNGQSLKIYTKKLSL